MPPDYGGVIDVYHKIRALRNAGANVHLHSYACRDRLNPDLTKSPADTTYIYERDMSQLNLLSRHPFIVATRRNSTLLECLTALPPGSPILFEGKHTTYFLDHPGLKDKLKIVRTHNVEHDYYRQLALNSKGIKKRYCRLEARKLAKYEKKLAHADVILAISPQDKEYFSRQFPKTVVEYVPCFYDDSSLSGPVPTPLENEARPYMLYHGNLGVAENVEAVNYALDRLMPLTEGKVELKVAGRGGDAGLRRKIEASPNASLIDSPGEEEMARLIGDASVVLLLTNQNTGIKLKLLDTLVKARGTLLATPEMVGDPVVAPLLEVAPTASLQAEAIEKALTLKPDSRTLTKRREILLENFNTVENARRILTLIDRLRN